MPSDRDQLLEFGFEAARVDWALKATGSKGLQPAMDHILANQDQPVPDAASVSASASAPLVGATSGGGVVDEDEDMKAAIALSQEGAEAKSIKCSECGKVFRNTALAEFHAEKSGHDQFEESTEEIKPLTEEEKRQKLAELRQKMAEKRAQTNVKEAEDAKSNEALRRKAGKDAGKIKEDLKVKEVEKEAEQRRREKLEDAKAKQRVREQIEADKRARAEKFAREKALREGQPLPESQSQTQPPTGSSAAAAGSSSSAPGAKKEYTNTRLQIRLASGGTYTTTLPVTGTLRDVAEFLAAQTMAVSVESVGFSTTFPRKEYSHKDWTKTLAELGLTPSAVLMASSTSTT